MAMKNILFIHHDTFEFWFLRKIFTAFSLSYLGDGPMLHFVSFIFEQRATICFLCSFLLVLTVLSVFFLFGKSVIYL